MQAYLRLRLDDVNVKPDKNDSSKVYYNAYESNNLYTEDGEAAGKQTNQVGLTAESYPVLKKLVGQTVLLAVSVSARAFGGGFPKPSYYDGQLVVVPELVGAE
jgi:hypothetical protein